LVKKEQRFSNLKLQGKLGVTDQKLTQRYQQGKPGVNSRQLKWLLTSTIIG